MDENLVNELVKRIVKLEQEVEFLGQKRVYQQDIVPHEVKNRHLGEPNTYIRTGLSTSRPTTGTSIKLGLEYFGTQVWFEYDTNKLYIWKPNTNAWVSVTLA